MQYAGESSHSHDSLSRTEQGPRMLFW